jgi:EAL domain-containing protein (putative c-di-GMP-specific phosphodiesterase class I)
VAEDFRTVFQPIVELVTDETVGYEAFSRFDDGIAPDDQLARATADGQGIELEVLLTRAAVTSARTLPAGMWLALNVSVDLATAGRALQHAVGLSTCRLVYELDLRRAASLEQLRQTVAVLPPDGAIALAGVTAGYESLAVVTDIRPRYVKLDPKWAVDVHDDPARQALIGALVAVAADTGCDVIAEGIEVDAQREMLCELGVRYGQGYLLGRPSVRPERAFLTDLGR